MSDESRTTKSRKTLLSYFNKAGDGHLKNQGTTSTDDSLNERPLKSPRVVFEPQTMNINSLERDPGLRQPIKSYSVNQQDDIRRKYIHMGAYQPKLDIYPRTLDGKQYRRFQYSWFKSYPWLEYSESKDSAFCFQCFLFDNNSSQSHSAFTCDGFNNWKRVNGDRCAFIHHVGGPCSIHNSAMCKWDNLKNPSVHIDKVIHAQSAEQVLQNRLRLKTTIKTVQWLALQACPFRGHDESFESENRGNFLEMVKLLADNNEEIKKVVLENAPGNAKYTSPKIQKEILHILANRVRNGIRGEIAEAKFCILVDEALDESNKEQMAIVLRFVDLEGLIRERFFEIVRVDDTSALNLKKEVCNVLTRHNLLVENIRGQGYDGASNMRGAWNGLQALFLRDCSHAYYVHCFAHRLQLALVAASKDVHDIWLFFSKLSTIVNLLSASHKRHMELKTAKEIEIVDMLASGELQTGKGANQIRTLQRAGATRWSSHFGSISRLIDMFGPACSVLDNIAENGQNNNIRGEANGAYKEVRSFEFCFVMLLLKKIMGITEILCQALQRKSQDILNALSLVSSTKILIQKLREDGWVNFMADVSLFCERYDIEMPSMSDRRKERTGRKCQQQNDNTHENYYHVDIFNAVIDFQLVELDSRFTEKTVELLILSSALDPTNGFMAFKIEEICSLADKFYSQDFSTVEIQALRLQLEHFEVDVIRNSAFQNLSSLSELSRKLFESKKSLIYYLIDRLIRLVLTLPISTATTERAFSAMKLVKTTLRNKMEDDFLNDCMVIYIKREFIRNVDLDSIVDEFYSLSHRRAQLQ